MTKSTTGRRYSSWKGLTDGDSETPLAEQARSKCVRKENLKGLRQIWCLRCVCPHLFCLKFRLFFFFSCDSETLRTYFQASAFVSHDHKHIYSFAMCLGWTEPPSASSLIFLCKAGHRTGLQLTSVRLIQLSLCKE